MARKPRLHYPGAFYHVIQRGNARQDIFFEETDRSRFFLLLQEVLSRFGGRVHAYCLMTNHVHLAIQVGEVPLSRIMQNLSFRYTRWINWKRDRSGHLFQGRYKSVVVDADAYLVQLVSYLHLNPVRAGMVDKPVDYPWSSHRAYLGLETVPWLTTDSVLGRFSKESDQARRLFGSFVTGNRDEGHRDEFHGGAKSDSRFLGEDTFIETVLNQVEKRQVVRPRLDAVEKAVKKLYGLRKGDLAARGQGKVISEARAMAAWAVQELSDSSLTELSRRTGRDVTSLSSAIRRLRQRASRDQALATRMEKLREMVIDFASLMTP